jgi:hypothetical protein
MGVAKKYRRKIEVQGRCFLWCVKEDLDWLVQGCLLALSIVAEDKHLIISYGIGQAETDRHLVSLGKEFAKLTPEDSKVGYQRVRCPQWEQDGAITPEIVRRIIEWCCTYDVDAIEVNWRGEILK